MDGFGDNFVPNGETNGVAAEDPAAEFLAREQSELAAIEDPTVVVTETVDDAPEEQVSTDPLPADDALPAETSGDDAAAPKDDTPEPAEPLDPLAGAMEPPAASRTPERVVTPVPRVEPEAIREWREEHQRKLVTKDESEETAKDALREKARQELADWYRQHDEQLAKTRQANRCAEKELVADTERPEPGTEWERIAKLCDFNPKTAKSSRDVSRMRSIILHVKQSPPMKA